MTTTVVVVVVVVVGALTVRHRPRRGPTVSSMCLVPLSPVACRLSSLPRLVVSSRLQAMDGTADLVVGSGQAAFQEGTSATSRGGQGGQVLPYRELRMRPEKSLQTTHRCEKITQRLCHPGRPPAPELMHLQPRGRCLPRCPSSPAAR